MTKVNGSDFQAMTKAGNYIGLIPELRSIRKNKRPKRSCPKWYAEGIEQADFAYQTNEGWKLTDSGLQLLLDHDQDS